MGRSWRGSSPATTAPSHGGYRGVAPDANIVSLKVGVADGGADVSQVIAAIDWVVQHRNDNGHEHPRDQPLLRHELDPAVPVDPLAYAVEQAWKAGIVVVAAAGNTGYQTGASAQGLADPAYDPQILAVGAADTGGRPRRRRRPRRLLLGERRQLQRRLPRARLVAPGRTCRDFVSPARSIDQNNPTGILSDRYFRGSGTSEATAFVFRRVPPTFCSATRN